MKRLDATAKLFPEEPRVELWPPVWSFDLKLGIIDLIEVQHLTEFLRIAPPRRRDEDRNVIDDVETQRACATIGRLAAPSQFTVADRANGQRIDVGLRRVRYDIALP